MKIECVWFCAFEAFSDEEIKKVENVEVEAETVKEALDEAFRRFNHGGPGTGDLAELHETRSLSVGDIVRVDGKDYACAPMGWREQKDGPDPRTGSIENLVGYLRSLYTVHNE